MVIDQSPKGQDGPPGLATTGPEHATAVAGDQPEPEPQLPPEHLEIASNLPDPARPYWWFTTTPLPHLKISAGGGRREDPHTRLPLEADYWCHEGDPAWTKVDRTHRPKPRVKERKKSVRRKARPKH